MVTVEYNVGPESKGPGFVLFTTGHVTVVKEESGWLSAIFNDETGGQETTISIDPCVLDAMIEMRKEASAGWITIQPAPDKAAEGLDTPF